MRPNEGCRRAGSAAARPDGAGAVLTALLLLIPRTSSLGILLATAFWGGAICIHMAHTEVYPFQAMMLVMTWAGAYLRKPAMFSGESRPRSIWEAADPLSRPRQASAPSVGLAAYGSGPPPGRR